MKKYKLVVVYNKNNDLSAEIITANDFCEALVLRNMFNRCKNVLTVSQPIMWLGADGPTKCQKLLKTW